MGKKEKTFKISLLFGAILIISLLHYLTQRREMYYHLFYRELYFLPLILGGVWFGLWGAVLTSLSITILYSPLVVIYWQGFSVNDFDQILGLLLFNIVAIILGVISGREKVSLKALQEAETLATLGGVVSGIVHDMKIPLVAIGGYARSMKRRLADQDPNHEKLDTIVKETQRLEDLTKDILAYARPVQLNRVSGELNNLVRKCCPTAAELARQRKVKIETLLSSSLPTILFDPAAMERALLNLVYNAIQASPEVGVVTVRTDQEGREEVISIANDGPGIPLEIRKEIFSPFFTTKKEGTGLGLSIALKIVKAHDGTIKVTDNGEKGTIVKVSLPTGR